MSKDKPISPERKAELREQVLRMIERLRAANLTAEEIAYCVHKMGRRAELRSRVRAHYPRHSPG